MVGEEICIDLSLFSEPALGGVVAILRTIDRVSDYRMHIQLTDIGASLPAMLTVLAFYKSHHHEVMRIRGDADGKFATPQWAEELGKRGIHPVPASAWHVHAGVRLLVSIT